MMVAGTQWIHSKDSFFAQTSIHEIMMEGRVDPREHSLYEMSVFDYQLRC